MVKSCKQDDVSSWFLINELVTSKVLGGTIKSRNQKEKYRFKSNRESYLFMKVNLIIKKLKQC